MHKSRKRKQLELDRKPQSESESESGTKLTKDPYPTHTRPTREECIAVRDDLLALHGFPKEFAKYRRDENQIQLDDGDAKETVLDGLVKTVLSQNTTEVNSLRAFDSLKSAFPTWEDVLAAESKCLENAIRCGGLAPTKASCIKNILNCLLEKKGKLCLEYLRDLSVDEIKAELSQFKGIGPKTVACVLMFNLQLDDFPVDTHVFEIAKAIGWVPALADRNKTYLHLNQCIPNELKFDLNCLLYTHGKLCRKCTKKACPMQLLQKRVLYSLGNLNSLAGVDSFYEYLFKAHILFGKEEFWRMFHSAYLAVQKYFRHGPWYHEADMRTGKATYWQLTSLQAFWPGLQVFAGPSNVASYRKILSFAPRIGRVNILLISSHQRSFIVSLEGGFASVKDVTTMQLEDHQHRFFLTETCKYLYLLFDDSFLVDRNYIFTTEGHPPPVLRDWHDRLPESYIPTNWSFAQSEKQARRASAMSL
ncbi:hypothetical protein CMV_024689 [Castanea mollissima]|uniref:HhH-GPD domain-containing protein n=1 Tax=Castanea mollissima TaxID=60419 RepID=A0A8J4VHN5_9ROSI|nr:hypothetical protein CMV_024689 [Castanea mollissima]